MATEDEARAFLEDWLGRMHSPAQKVTVTDETEFDSLATMNLVFFLEESGPRIAEETIAQLTNWPAVVAYLRKPFYKALVLDADGVLWAGVIGEGRIAPFPNVQEAYLALKKRGVLLCLATKNNRADVDAAFAFEGMVLRQEDFAILECGWHNKTESLQRIAETLNIGIDSIVFVDDSQFECEAVRQQLPEVTVLHCPTKLALGVAREAAALFPEFVDTAKTAQYHALAQARDEQGKFATEAEFLASLGIKVTLHHNKHGEAARIAELTQKSNQFNLTTRRYKEIDIRRMMNQGCDVWTISYSDRFGDQGITGVLILTEDRHIDTFLLSCRILGRGVEKAIWDVLGDRAVTAEYIPTTRNEQVADLWRNLGMEQIQPGRYVGCPEGKAPWIEVA